MTAQKGFAPIFLIGIAAIGISSFLLFTYIAPFKDSKLSVIFPKENSFAATTQTLTLNTIADTYINDAHSGTNYGQSASLVSDNDPDVIYSMFKFDLSSLTGKTISAAKLKFKTTPALDSGSKDILRIRVTTDTSWDENKLTWRTRPSLGGRVGLIKNAASNVDYQTDLDLNLIKSKAGQILSLAIKSEDKDALLILSKEGGSPAQLLVTVLNPDQPIPTGAPNPTPTPTIVVEPSPTPRPVVSPTPTRTPTPTPRPVGLPSPTPTPTPVVVGGIWKPALNTPWQWQLTGTVDTSVNVAMFDIDLFDNSASVVSTLHAKGAKVICYISAGTYEDWRPDAASFPAAVLGSSNGWPGEKWLDIRNITALAPVMRARMDLCKSKGFDGLEPDNIDGYTNSTGFPLTANDQITYNRWLATEAHARGLSVGLKNDVDQISSLVGNFDWALNEQCFQYSECGGYSAFVNAGKAVFEVEYSLQTSQFCSQANSMNFNALKKGLDLDAPRTACR